MPILYRDHSKVLDMIIDVNGLIIIFAIASIVAILAKLIRWPYTITLVLAGIFVVILGLETPAGLTLDRDLIFHILLPPLLFEGALHMRLSHLKENAKIIALLVLPGLMLSVFLVAALLNLAFPVYPFIILLLIAAIIIPTDPASILAFYKEMKVPKKLRSIVEGESVFDDGLAIVLFGVILTVIIAIETTGAAGVSSQNVVDGVAQFLKLSFLGVLLGIALGYGAYLVLRRINDKFTEVMITVILAFGIFALAETVEASGVLAVVVAGLILGNYGTRVAMAPSSRMTLLNFWSFLAFAVTSFLFIMVGMSVELSDIWDNIVLIIASVLCLWLARALMVFIIGRIVNRKSTELPKRWQITMWWGGLRGAIPIAMALSIPVYALFINDGNPANDIYFPYRDTIIAVTFGVVLSTLIIQGFTLRPMLRRLGFYGVSKKEAEAEEREVAALLKDSMDELSTLQEDGELSKQGYDWLTMRFGQINSQLITEMGSLIQEHGFIPKEEYIFTVHEALEQKKKAISDAWARNLISGSTGEKLIFEIESQIAALTSETAEEKLRSPVEILRSVTGTEVASIERNCGICMDLIGPGQSVIKCRCGTIFHLNCLENIDRCPICIAPLEKPGGLNS
ncbi:MAG: hypothetical protein AYK23_04495 [Candidatus Proteinoplasmatales archaeon SG8-5]|nr:MAG: hypothetical protein AYK23_04495 [Candidatus Proteinoplasmatales archaeon SG8-5]